ncbi:jg15377 [Pararge aegeria aegeria]|uniref:Jg15377 protein n=1 Tax=Pararge aegeria aegeria TaxID=348720 RepID=A0A8S4SA86_9NEOP|nr:jg15377 [Pararge aegeria aegeria]
MHAASNPAIPIHGRMENQGMPPDKWQAAFWFVIDQAADDDGTCHTLGDQNSGRNAINTKVHPVPWPINSSRHPKHTKTQQTYHIGRITSGLRFITSR